MLDAGMGHPANEQNMYVCMMWAHRKGKRTKYGEQKKTKYIWNYITWTPSSSRTKANEQMRRGPEERRTEEKREYEIYNSNNNNKMENTQKY